MANENEIERLREELRTILQKLDTVKSKLNDLEISKARVEESLKSITKENEEFKKLLNEMSVSFRKFETEILLSVSALSTKSLMLGGGLTTIFGAAVYFIFDLFANQ